MAGKTATILERTSLEGLDAALRGPVVWPGHPTTRLPTVFNAMIDRTPQVIARCVDVADVINAVGFARQQDVDLAIRGGAHNGGASGPATAWSSISHRCGGPDRSEARLAYVGAGPSSATWTTRPTRSAWRLRPALSPPPVLVA